MDPNIDRQDYGAKGNALVTRIRDLVGQPLSGYDNRINDTVERWGTGMDKSISGLNNYLSGRISTKRMDPYLDYLPEDVRKFLGDERMPIRLMYSLLTMFCLFGLEVTVIQNIKEFGKEALKLYLILNCLTSFRFNLLRDNRVGSMRVFLISSTLILTCIYFGSLVLGYVLALKFIKDMFLSNQCKNKGNKTITSLLFIDKISEALAYQAIAGNLLNLPLLIFLYVVSLVSSLMLGRGFDSRLGISEVRENDDNRNNQVVKYDDSNEDKIERDKGIKDIMYKGAHVTFGTSLLMAVSWVPSPLISRGLSPDTFNVDQMLSIMSYTAAFSGLVSTRIWEYLLKGSDRSLDEFLLRICLIKTILYASLYFLEAPFQGLVFPLLGFNYALLRFVVRSSVNLLEDKKLFYFWSALSFGGLITFYVFSFMSPFMPLYCLIGNLIIQFRLYMLSRDGEDKLMTMVEESRREDTDPNVGLSTLYSAVFSSLILYTIFGFGFKPLLLLMVCLWGLYYVNLGNQFYRFQKIYLVSILEVIVGIRFYCRRLKVHLDSLINNVMIFKDIMVKNLNRFKEIVFR